MSERDDVWVEIEVSRGGGAIGAYRGRMSRVTLQRWVEGTLTRGAVTLDDVYWWTEDPESEDGGEWTVLGHSPGAYERCTGRAYVGVEQILVIEELADGGERDAAIAETLGPRSSYPS